MGMFKAKNNTIPGCHRKDDAKHGKYIILDGAMYRKEKNQIGEKIGVVTHLGSPHPKERCLKIQGEWVSYFPIQKRQMPPIPLAEKPSNTAKNKVPQP